MAIVGDAYVIVHAITTGVEKEINDAMNNISTAASKAGNSVNKSFRAAASDGLTAAEKEAIKTYRAINALIEKSYYLQGAIAGLVPVIGALVGGLFALGSQVAAATPALIVLPSVFMAMGQAMLSVKLAMSGVTKAIGQMAKQKKSAGIDNMPALLEAYAAAQERVHNSDKRLAKALKDLDKAQKDAKESLQQLNFEAEDAAISEQKAAMAFEEARRNLLAVQEMPVGSAVRKEAELAFAEADLNLRRAIDRNADLAEETARRNAAGVDGSEEVIAAQENVTDAQNEQQKALIALAKATENLNKKQSGGGGGGTDPLANLSESAKAFAKFIYGLKPKLDELKAAAGDGLFGPLTKAVNTLVKGGMFDSLKKIVSETGKAAGNTALDFAKIVSESKNLKNLNAVSKTNTDTISKLGTVVGNLYSVFLSLLAAADPLIRRFTDWAVKLTTTWKNAELLENRSGRLTKAFNAAGDVAAQLGRIIKNIGGAFYQMGQAAAGPGSGGQLILDYFETATAKFKEFTTQGNKDGSLEQYFLKTSEAFTKVMHILGIVTKAILKTGDDEGTSSFLDSLANAAEILGEALSKLTEGGAGGAFGKFIEQMAGFIAHTSEAGSLKIYFGILTRALGLLNNILSNPIAAKLLGLAAAAHGGRMAFGRLGKTFNTVGKYITGDKLSIKSATKNFIDLGKGFQYSFNMMKGAGKSTFDSIIGGLKQAFSQTKIYAAYQKVAAAATKTWAGVQKVFNLIMAGNPVALTVLAIVALVAAVVIAYKKFAWFRDGLKSIFKAIGSYIEFMVNLWIDGLNIMIRAINWINPFSDIPEIPEFSFGSQKTFPTKGATGNETNGAYESRARPRGMAVGGIVRPRTGGTLALIGEAGRSERVEPLDPNGLSKRDKAMIEMLSGGTGKGMTFNIYATKGMDEIELAAAVSRQVARTLKKGGV